MTLKKDKIDFERPEIRRQWVRSPITKVKSSNRVYRRQKEKLVSLEISDSASEQTGDFNFCPRCTYKLEKRQLDGRSRLQCPNCDYIYYHNPVPAVGAIVTGDSKILMVKRKFNPKAGFWSLPAGFIEYEESPVACVVREVKEETGLDIAIDRLFNVYAAQDDPRSHVVLIIYLAHIAGGALQPGDDAVDARFFAPNELPPNIAFSAHRRALTEFLKR